MATRIRATFVDGPRAGETVEVHDPFFFKATDGRQLFAKYRWEQWPVVMMNDIWEPTALNSDSQCLDFEMKFVQTSRFNGIL